jgi:hypothetical protein
VEDHVATIEGSVAKFFSDGGLFDRGELVAALRKSLNGKGTFTLLLGGKSGLSPRKEKFKEEHASPAIL